MPSAEADNTYLDLDHSGSDKNLVQFIIEITGTLEFLTHTVISGYQFHVMIFLYSFFHIYIYIYIFHSTAQNSTSLQSHMTE